MDMYLTLASFSLCAAFCFSQNTGVAGPGSFRELYERVSNRRLSAIAREQQTDSSPEQCAELCVKTQSFYCKSFDFDNSRKTCLLYTVNHEDRDIRLLDNQFSDHYQSAHLRLFSRTPGHRLHTWINTQRQFSTVEQCARLCVLETRFKCESFNFEPSAGLCLLTEFSESEAYGLTADASADFYKRQPEGDLKNFINFGQASLTPLTDFDVYDRVVPGKTLDECATECIMERTFHCASFDYIHEAEWSQCQLSKYIAANVQGLQEANPNHRVNHYERIEEDLTYFYPTPYYSLPGTKLRTYSLVTPARCARMCMQEQGFVCRSFDYQVEDGTCTLSDKTGSDVGFLFNDDQEVHHFEMKPILDCGGNLTGPYGDLASPGWPRNYTHHERCVWNITVPQNKVISLQFTHLSLVTHFSRPCTEGDDRLIVTEADSDSCIQPGTKFYVTKGNKALISFYSNSEKDAQGFRAFYTAEWTCDAHLSSAPGDFASPQWPNNYQPSMLCSWRISAPDGYRVRLYFTSFQLESHSLNHCNEQAHHVKVLDGGSVNAKLIGLYCGSRSQFSVTSTSSDLFVQFYSDSSARTHHGFHATFVFEPASSVPSPADHQPLLPPLQGEGGAGEEGERSQEEGQEDGSQEDMSNEEDSMERDFDPQQDIVPRTAAVAASPVSRRYKATMWAIISVLLVLLVAVSVTLFIVWRHYRRKMAFIYGLVQAEESLLGVEHSAYRVTYQVKPNNITLGNERHLEASGSGIAYTSVHNAERSPVLKYIRENAKNVNLAAQAGAAAGAEGEGAEGSEEEDDEIAMAKSNMKV